MCPERRQTSHLEDKQKMQESVTAQMQIAHRRPTSSAVREIGALSSAGQDGWVDNGTATGKSLVVSSKTKLGKFIPGHLSQRNENVLSQKNCS